VSYAVGSSSFSAVSHLLFSGVNLHALQCRYRTRQPPPISRVV